MTQHICKNSTCLFVNRDGVVVCRITGRCKKQFICANEYRVETNDLFTPIAKQSQQHVSNKRETNNGLTEIHIIKEVNRYVRLLLYSNIRNDISANTSISQHNKKRRMHYKKRRKVEILEFKKNVFETICNDIQDLIIKLSKYNRSLKLKSIIIALLFLKQHGKEYKTKTQNKFIITRSEYLYDHLPSVSDLHLFSIQKNLNGRNQNIG